MFREYRSFGPYEFRFIGDIQPLVDRNGKILEYNYKLPTGVRSNRYGLGPFCKFKLDCTATAFGVYAITVQDVLQYIGECQNLFDRFGPTGYGYVAARNCHHDGQATNCKVNSLVLAAAKSNQRIGVWFYATTFRKSIETELVNRLQPPWNGRLIRPIFSCSDAGSILSTSKSVAPIRKRGASITTRDEFLRVLGKLFAEAKHIGVPKIDVNSGQLHRQVGNYPGPNHRMPVCCDAMRSAMASGDQVMESPPQGKGAGLTIRYRLPRPSTV
jgi:hypothetical protein